MKKIIARRLLVTVIQFTGGRLDVSTGKVYRYEKNHAAEPLDAYYEIPRYSMFRAMLAFIESERIAQEYIDRYDLTLDEVGGTKDHSLWRSANSTHTYNSEGDCELDDRFFECIHDNDAVMDDWEDFLDEYLDMLADKWADDHGYEVVDIPFDEIDDELFQRTARFTKSLEFSVVDDVGAFLNTLKELKRMDDEEGMNPSDVPHE